MSANTPEPLLHRHRYCGNSMPSKVFEGTQVVLSYVSRVHRNPSVNFKGYKASVEFNRKAGW